VRDARPRGGPDLRQLGFDVTNRTRRARGEEIGVAVAPRSEQSEQRPKIMLPQKPLYTLPMLVEPGGVRSLNARRRVRERTCEPDRLSDRRDGESEMKSVG
jgi:hypothetical protein